MPMLLLVPRLLDGGAGRYAMLGLGDVVLPGLLLAFARRLDLAAAAQAVALSRGAAECAPCDEGYSTDGAEGLAYCTPCTPGTSTSANGTATAAGSTG